MAVHKENKKGYNLKEYIILKWDTAQNDRDKNTCEEFEVLVWEETIINVKVVVINVIVLIVEILILIVVVVYL